MKIQLLHQVMIKILQTNYNIEMIPWVNRWNVLFSGGAHCCSVDLEREGKLVDYFS